MDNDPAHASHVHHRLFAVRCACSHIRIIYTYHLARHSFATEICLTKGVPIESVSKMLGHTNVQTTQIYARITDRKINSDMAQLSMKIDPLADALQRIEVRAFGCLLEELLARCSPNVAPQGDFLRGAVDAQKAFILLIVAGVGFVTTVYAKKSVEKEIPADRHNFFYAVWVLALCGLLGITVTG